MMFNAFLFSLKGYSETLSKNAYAINFKEKKLHGKFIFRNV